MEFTDKEIEILKILQKNLPDSLTPYAHIADEVGLGEEYIINFIKKLKDNKVIRRFGASIKHQKTGYDSNAMVAWKIDDSLIDEAGEIAAKHNNISHCYHRPSPSPDWNYTLFTMIHGKTKQECLNVIEDLKKTTKLDEHIILESIQELKKTSMVYFKD